MSPENRLILVKHSLPEIVKNIPAREWDLSGEGRDRAKELAKKLTQHRPETIVSSVEPKAQQTAEILGECLGLKPHMARDLHEHDRSQSPFYPNDEFESLVQKFFQEPGMLVFGKETANQALFRFKNAVKKVLDSHGSKMTLIVSHGTVISLFVSQATGIEGYQLWKDLGLPSFIVLDLETKTHLEIGNLS